MAKGKLYIFSAPSGGGKSSLARALVETDPGTVLSVSHTTRSPRPGERDGVDYHFVDKRQFKTMVDAAEFLEHAEVFDNYYGTSKKTIEALLDRGRNVILDIDWQGMREIKKRMPDAISVFILPPSREELRKRLQDRKQDSDEVVERRMRDAVNEMSHYGEFDLVVLNDDFDAALEDLRTIIAGQGKAIRPLGIEPKSLLEG